MTNYNGKAIYNPSGKAGEYAEWACNFYAGCSNGCEYCYLTKGWTAKTYVHRYPKLKAHFRDEEHALEIFERELILNLSELQKHGIFFSFTTDPMLPETIYLTLRGVAISLRHDIPIKILTKRADFVDFAIFEPLFRLESEYKRRVAIGFTLTGHDELEPGASTNAERIAAMWKLHDAGFKTFASIEPIVDFESSLKMIEDSRGACNLYKIGLMSGKKYPRNELCDFFYTVNQITEARIYWKDSVLRGLGFDRSSFEFDGFENIVDRDFNIFNIK